MKTEIIQLHVEIADHLLNAAKIFLLNSFYRSITEIVNLELVSKSLCHAVPLPYNPARISKIEQKYSNKLFPRKRTTIRVPKDSFSLYKEKIYNHVIEQFSIDKNLYLNVSNRYVIEVILWMKLKLEGNELKDSYFKDDVFTELINIDNVVREVMIRAMGYYKQIPTAREYDEYQKMCGGPSLSYVKSKYGTYNDALIMNGFGS